MSSTPSASTRMKALFDNRWSEDSSTEYRVQGTEYEYPVLGTE